MSCFLSSGDNYKLSIGVDSKMIMTGVIEG